METEADIAINVGFDLHLDRQFSSEPRRCPHFMVQLDKPLLSIWRDHTDNLQKAQFAACTCHSSSCIVLPLARECMADRPIASSVVDVKVAGKISSLGIKLQLEDSLCCLPLRSSSCLQHHEAF